MVLLLSQSQFEVLTEFDILRPRAAFQTRRGLLLSRAILRLPRHFFFCYNPSYMVITYCGMAFMKVQFGDTTLAFNPLGKNAEMSGPRFGADVAFVSLKDPNFNGTEQLSYGEKVPFVVNGPGEYEIKGVYVKGVASEGPNNKINTIYSVVLEGISLCHLGSLASPDIPAAALEAIGEVDVLFVPAWGGDALSTAAADKVVAALEPKIIIPLFKGPKGDGKDALKAFLKEIGEEGGTPLDKLTLKKKDLEGKEGEVMVLESVA